MDPLLSRAHEGSGIGLAIVKSLVEMHGGTINVKSVYQQGTEFIISLPVNLVDHNDDSKIGLVHQTNSEKYKLNFQI